MKAKTIKSPTGNILFIETKSDISNHERILLDLTNGVPPKNKNERNLLRDIKKIESKGNIVDIPAN